MNRRRWLLLFKLTVAALVVWGIVRAVNQARAEIATQPFAWESVRVGWLALAGMCYAVGTLPMAWYWHHVLTALGQRPGFLEALTAFTIGHLGKYFPGKVMVVVLRGGLIRSQRVDATVATISVFVETLTMMASGAALAAAVTALYFWQQRVLCWLAAALTLGLATVTAPPVMRFLATRTVHRVHAEPQTIAALLRALSWRLCLRGWLASLLGWLLMSASLWATLVAIGGVAARDLSFDVVARVTAATTLAVVAGFLSLIPGGVGVREWVIMQLLSPAFTSLIALLAPVFLRLVWLLTELTLSSILYCMRIKVAPPA